MEDYVDFETAQMLKRAMFDLPCQRYFIKVNEADIEPSMIKASYSPENWNDGRHSDPPFAKPICSAPTLAQAQKWLREVKGWHIEVRVNGTRKMFAVMLWKMDANGYCEYLECPDGRARLHDRYEDALRAGISETLKLIEEEER